MKSSFNWKIAILSGLVLLVLGMAFFVLIGSKIDFTCQNTTPHTIGCRAYNGINTVTLAYADIWHRIFTPRCLGGNGPDDCLGPDGVIMMVTLFAIGFVIGGFRWTKKSTL